MPWWAIQTVNKKRFRRTRWVLAYITRPVFGFTSIAAWYFLGRWYGQSPHVWWQNLCASVAACLVLLVSSEIYDRLLRGWRKLLRDLEKISIDDGVGKLPAFIDSMLPGWRRQMMEARANAERRKRDGL